MTEFNLLPEDYRKKRSKMLAPLSLVVMLLTIAITVAGLESFLAYKTRKIGYVRIVKRQLEQQEIIADIDRKTERVRRKFKPYLDLVSTHYPWSNLLIGVAGAAGDGVWLTQITGAATDNQCTLNGNARTTEAVFDFIAALKRKEFFKSIRLNSMNTNVLGEVKRIHFEISCLVDKKPI